MTKAPVRVGMGRLNLLAGRDRSLIAVVAAPKVWEQWTIRSSSVGCGKGGCDNIQYLSSTYNEGEITCDLPMPYIVSKSVGSSSFFPQHASSDLMPRSYFFFLVVDSCHMMLPKRRLWSEICWIPLFAIGIVWGRAASDRIFAIGIIWGNDINQVQVFVMIGMLTWSS